MKSLLTYINEELDAENLLWKLDMWFNNNEEDQKIFIELVVLVKENGSIKSKELEKYLEQYPKFRKNIKQFVDFVNDDIKNDKEVDYYYQLIKILKMTFNNKSNENKYHK